MAVNPSSQAVTLNASDYRTIGLTG